MQAAIRTETVMGDLRKASQSIRTSSSRYEKTDRAVAATALVRMAECHEKLGYAQARALFARLVPRLSDRPESIRARTGLSGDAADGRAVFAGSRNLWAPTGEVVIHGKASPDGRFIPYLTDHLFLHDLVTGTDRQVTNETGRSLQEAEYAEGSAFSRDGRQLAYGWRLRGRNAYSFESCRSKATGYRDRQLSSTTTTSNGSSRTTGRRTADSWLCCSDIRTEPRRSPWCRWRPVNCARSNRWSGERCPISRSPRTAATSRSISSRSTPAGGTCTLPRDGWIRRNGTGHLEHR